MTTTDTTNATDSTDQTVVAAPTMKLQLPFTGMYYSLWDMIVNNSLELFDDSEEGEFCYTDAFNAEFAQKYADAMAEHIADLMDYECDNILEGRGLDFTNAQMISPREYNFATDRIVVDIKVSDFVLIHSLVGNLPLSEVVKDRHTSYDGFHSFYSNDLTHWQNLKPEDCDLNEAHTFLLAALTDLQDHNDYEPVIAELLDDAILRLVMEHHHKQNPEVAADLADQTDPA